MNSPNVNIDAERAIIGALILKGERIPEVSDLLAPDDFHDPRHRTLYRALLALSERGLPVDFIHLGQVLGDDLDRIGGHKYLLELANGVASAAHLTYHARIVSTAAASRRQFEVLGDLLAKAKSGADPRALAEDAQRRLGAIASRLQPGRPAWPTIDPGKLHGLAGDFARLVAPHTDADPAALYATFLALYGVAAGRGVHFEIGATTHYLNMAVLVIGQTARARKGTALDWGLALFKLADPEFARDHLGNGLVSGEGLIEALRDPVYERQPIKEKGQIIDYQDVLVDPGVADKRMLSVEPEFPRVLAKCAVDGSSLAAVIRDLLDGKDLRSMARRKNALRATAPHGSILGHGTIEEFRAVVRPGDIYGGTVNRLLIVCARRSRVLPIPTHPSESEWATLARRLREALDWARSQPVRLVFDSEAEILWRASYSGLTREAGGAFGAAVARSDALTWKHAAMLAALDRSATIRREHVAAALDFWAYAESSAAVLFPEGLPAERPEGRQPRDPGADLVKLILRHGGAASPAELRAWSRKYQGPRVAEAALQEIADAGLGVWREDPPGPAGGRPTRRLHVLGGVPVTETPTGSPGREGSSYTDAAGAPGPSGNGQDDGDPSGPACAGEEPPSGSVLFSTCFDQNSPYVEDIEPKPGEPPPDVEEREGLVEPEDDSDCFSTGADPERDLGGEGEDPWSRFAGH